MVVSSSLSTNTLCISTSSCVPIFPYRFSHDSTFPSRELVNNTVVGGLLDGFTCGGGGGGRGGSGVISEPPGQQG